MNISSDRSKVILLTAPAAMGGLESVVASLAVGLADAGRQILLVQLLTPGSNPAVAFDAITHSNVTAVRLTHRARDYVGVVRDVRRLMKTYPAAIVHSHGARADLIAALAQGTRRRFLSTVHGFVKNSAKQRLTIRLHLLVLRRADRVIAVSRLLSAELARFVRDNRVVTIPNSPPRTAFENRTAARAALGIAADLRAVGWVGRASQEKGLDVFIECIAHVDDPKLIAVVIGDGPSLLSAKERAKALGLAHKFQWMGQLPEAARFFKAFDVLVLSSRTEGTPMTALEAIDAEVPVVATAVGGVPDLLSDGSGWLVPSERPRELARALQSALHDPVEVATRVARATARLLQSGSRAEWIATHERVYDQLTVR